MTLPQARSDSVNRAGALAPRRFDIEPLEDRIAPEGSLLDLNLNLVVQNVNITIQDINIVVAGNVIQVGVLSGPMTGTVTSTVTVV